MIKNIYNSKNIIKVSPEDTLSHVFSLLSSSHDAAFVFDDGQFLGIINPYYAVIKKSYPANTKAKHCLVHPPKVDINFPLKKVASLMIDSKIHYLPVWENQKFAGIISARRILSAIQNSPELSIKLSEYIKNRKPLVTVSQEDFLSKALSFFKTYKISKLVVISPDFKLKGILAHYDVISYLVTPKVRQHFGMREGNKIPILKQYVKNFMKTTVLTLRPSSNLTDACEMILNKKIGSVVLVDTENHPLSIVTTQDLLSFFVGRFQLPKVELSAKKLSKKSQRLVGAFQARVNKLFAKRGGVRSARVTVKEGGRGGVFQAVLSVFAGGGQIIRVVKREGKNLAEVLQDVIKKSK